MKNTHHKNKPMAGVESQHLDSIYGSGVYKVEQAISVRDIQMHSLAHSSNGDTRLRKCESHEWWTRGLPSAFEAMAEIRSRATANDSALSGYICTVLAIPSQSRMSGAMRWTSGATTAATKKQGATRR